MNMVNWDTKKPKKIDIMQIFVQFTICKNALLVLLSLLHWISYADASVWFMFL